MFMYIYTYIVYKCVKYIKYNIYFIQISYFIDLSVGRHLGGHTFFSYKYCYNNHGRAVPQDSDLIFWGVCPDGE